MTSTHATHRLLAQAVKLIEKRGDSCQVEFPDGGRCTVRFDQIVSLEAVGVDCARFVYQDDSRPDRPCDRCGRSYRGPAIYCSFECALLDA